MATPQSIANRRNQAMSRIQDAIGAEFPAVPKRFGVEMQHATHLEFIADALEGSATATQAVEVIPEWATRARELAADGATKAEIVEALEG